MKPGQTFGKYKIEKAIYESEFASVFLAHEISSGEPVAVRVLPPEYSRLSNDLKEFKKDFERLHQLQHPNLIKLLEAGHAGLSAYYVMELAEGGDLRKRLAEGMGPKRLLKMFAQLAKALDYIHRQKMVHRDIRPDNLLFDAEGNVRLTISTISKQKDVAERFKVTPTAYLAPEQIKANGDWDGRADFYSAGVTLYEVLTGQLPFQHDSTSVLEEMHLHQAIPKLPQRYFHFQPMLEKLMAKNPEDRYQNAREWLEDLKALASGTRLQQTAPATPAEQAVKASASKGGASRLIAVAVATALVGAGVWYLMVPQQPAPEAATEPPAEAAEELEAITEPVEVARPNPELDKMRTINQLMMQGLRDMESNRLIAPSDNNAFTRFKKVLELDPDNIGAIRGIKQIVSRLRKQVMGHVEQDQFNAANELYRQFYDVIGDADGMAQIGEYIAIAEANWQQEQQLKQQAKQLLAEKEAKAEEARRKRELEALQKRQQALKAALEQEQQQAQAPATMVAASDVGEKSAANEPEASAAAQTAARTEGPLQDFLASFVEIPGGQFMMGSELMTRKEKPLHQVSVAPFAMMKHEVTFALWDLCVSAGGCSHIPDDAGWGRGNRPVMNVSYQDIMQQFIPWLNSETGQTFRLPSEAEWEYAARAGVDAYYHWGNDISCEQARYGYRDKECGTQKSSDPIMQYQANAWGLYDMHGNVWEWTEDCWNANHQGAPASAVPRLEGDCSKRVLKGGSWSNAGKSLRATNRGGAKIDGRYFNFGFRLVKGRNQNQS